MADDTQQFDYAKLPDGSYAKFKKGTPPEEMRRRLTAAGLLKPQGAAPGQPQAKSQQSAKQDPSILDYAKAFGRGLYEGGKSMVKGLPEMAKPRGAEGSKERQEEVAYGPMGRFLLHTGQDVYHGLEQGAEARRKAASQGEGFAGQTIETLRNYPIIGHAIDTMVKGGPSFSPKSLEGAGELTSYAVAPEAAKRVVVDPIVNIVKDPGTFARIQSTKTAARYFGDEEAGAGVSKAKLVGKLNDLATVKDPDTGVTRPGKIRKALEANKLQTKKLAAQADASGATIDLEQIVKDKLDEGRSIARQRGDTKLLNQVNDLGRKGVEGTLDPQTNKWVPRNLKAVKPSEALQIMETLQTPAFEKPHPITDNLAKDLRQSVLREVEKTQPGIADSMRQSHNLIEADKTAIELRQKAFEGTKRVFVSLWRPRSAAGLAGNIALVSLMRSMGAGWFESAGTLVALRALWESAPSATARAAIWREVSEWFDKGQTNGVPPKLGGSRAKPTMPTGGPTTPQGGAAGPQQPPALPVAPTAQNTPQVTQNTGVKGALPPAPPPANAAPAAQATAPSASAVTPEASSVTPKTKAMLDRVDELQQRLENPKSGADKVQAQKGLEQVKKALDKDTPEAERKLIEQRMKAAERQAKHRAKGKSEAAPETQGTAVAEAGKTETGQKVATPIDPTLNPEQKLILRDSLVEQISKIQSSDFNVPQFLKGFKALQQKLPIDQQIEGLRTALERLQSGK